MISVAIHERGAEATLRSIRQAEKAGVAAVWLTSAAGDALTLFAAAARETQRIGLGTAIVPIYPRHPLLLAQQASLVAELAPGRLRLGVGPSHATQTEEWYGIPYARPLQHTREAIAILRQAFGGEPIDFQGACFQSRFQPSPPQEIPVLMSALGQKSFELAAEISDGAIAWVCPPGYLAGMPRGKRLIGHCFLAHRREGLAERVGGYLRQPNYERMRVASGLSPEQWAEAVCFTDLAGVARFRQESGADEVICSLFGPGQDELLELVGSSSSM